MGKPWTEERRKKIAEYWTPEKRLERSRSLSVILKGRKHSEETKQKLSLRWTPERRAKQSDVSRKRRLGKSWTEEQRKNNIIHWTDERRIAQSKIMREVCLNPEARGKSAETKSKRYYCDPEFKARLLNNIKNINSNPEVLAKKLERQLKSIFKHGFYSKEMHDCRRLIREFKQIYKKSINT